MSQIRRHYWDSSVFCSFLNKEANRVDAVEALLRDAHQGRSEIYTSSFSLVEVIKIKGGQPITEGQEKALIEFFEYPFIKIMNAERGVCERARQFVWRNGMKPKDSVHLATAEAVSKIVSLDGLFSWDGDFTGLNGTVPGIVFPLTVPFVQQPELKLGA